MRKFTIPELVSVCKRLEGVPASRALEIAMEEGISRNGINALRSMLGYTKKRKDSFSKSIKEKALSSVLAGKSPKAVAKKIGVVPSTVYTWCKKAGIEYSAHDFWTVNKIRTVCLLISRNRRISIEEDRECAKRIGATLGMVRSMRNRLKHKACKRWLAIAEKSGIYKNA